MKFFFYIIIVGSFANIKSCNKKDNYILWNETVKLKWEDFRGDIPANSEFDAASQVNLKVDFRIENKKLKNFSVICFFDKKVSWSKLNKEEGLSHEQVHFDIGELCARRLRQALFEINKMNTLITTQIIDEKIDLFSKELTEMQKNYDLQTIHSLDKPEQEIWNKKVKNDLKNMKRFSTPRLFL